MTSIPETGMGPDEDWFPDEAAEDCESIPSGYELAGGSHADNVAHMHARITLLNHLHADSTMCERFQLWSVETGREPILCRAVEVLDEIAMRIPGLDSRGELFEALGDDTVRGTVTVTVESEDEVTRLEMLSQQAAEVVDEFSGHWSSPESDEYVGRSVVELVRDEWGLNWPWLAIEIINMYLYRQLGRLKGWQYEIKYWYEPGPTVLDHQMPEDMFSVNVELGTHDESIGDALERVLESIVAEMNRVFDEPIEEVPTETPRGIFTNPEQIDRDVTWWYRSRLCGASIRSLAIEINPDGDSRRTVKEGIRRAQYWLGLPYWKFSWQ